MEEPEHPTCAELLDQVHAYIDGELEERLAKELLDHIACCPPCRAYLGSAEATRRALERLRSAEAWGDGERETLRRCLGEVLRRLRP